MTHQEGRALSRSQRAEYPDVSLIIREHFLTASSAQHSAQTGAAPLIAEIDLQISSLSVRRAKNALTKAYMGYANPITKSHNTPSIKTTPAVRITRAHCFP